MIKGVKKQLAVIRDHARDNGHLSEADTATLQRLLSDMRPAQNDNTPFTDEQLAKLSIIEKTGTGSRYVH